MRPNKIKRKIAFFLDKIKSVTNAFNICVVKEALVQN